MTASTSKEDYKDDDDNYGTHVLTLALEELQNLSVANILFDRATIVHGIAKLTPRFLPY